MPEPSPLDGPSLEIPLAPILERLSPVLRARMNRPPMSTDLVRVSLDATLQQLPRGAVRITFRELQLGGPPGLFCGGPGVDDTPVEVPLAEVLARLKPEQFLRRSGQKAVTVSESVPAVFTSRGGASPPKPAVAPVVRSATVTARDDLVSSRAMANAVVKGTVAAVAPPVARPAPSTAPSPAPIPPVPAVVPLPAAAPIPMSPSVALSAQPGTPPEPVRISLVSVAKSWPDPLRQEILTHHVAGFINVPFERLEAAMKNARPVFAWKELRQWVSPTMLSPLREHDELALELALAVVTPLFMARRASAARVKTAMTAPEMPDIFSSRKPGPAGPAAMAVPASPVPAREGAAPAAADSATGLAAALASQAAAMKAGQALSGPVAPADVVRRACQISGVSGALLATLDGLVIASQLPPGVSADTAAAFLPRMYGRLSEYTRELKLPDPMHMEMLAGNVPMQVFKVQQAYFAVVGKPAEPLPKTQLSVLAGQLSQRAH